MFLSTVKGIPKYIDELRLVHYVIVFSNESSLETNGGIHTQGASFESQELCRFGLSLDLNEIAIYAINKIVHG